MPLVVVHSPFVALLQSMCLPTSAPSPRTGIGRRLDLFKPRRRAHQPLMSVLFIRLRLFREPHD